MQLLVNHQLIPVVIHPKIISFEQICCKRSQDIAVTSLHCLLFSTSKSKTKTNLEKCYQCSVSIEISLNLKVCFFLVTYENQQFNCTPFDQSDHLNFCTGMITGKTNISHPLIRTRTCWYQEVRNVCFSEKLAMACFPITSVLRFAFCLITDEFLLPS